MSDQSPREELLELLRKKSIKTGTFTLASGATSDFYVDCRLTTLDARGARLVGKVGWELVRNTASELSADVASVGGLTMGADPIALAIAMASDENPGGSAPVQAYAVRKEPKGHGRGRQVEGNFESGDNVVVIDDVITTGGSTIKAIEAIEREGGKVAFVIVLVDRQEGGKAAIEEKGHKVFPIFTRAEILEE